MKRKYLVSVLLPVWVVLFASGVYAQEAEIRMESEELGAHQRPSVVFTHEKHADRMQCNRCHHDYDKFGSNRGQEGEEQRCAECHTATAAKNPIPLMKAFHFQCKGCHVKMAKTKRFNPPRTCGGCHKER